MGQMTACKQLWGLKSSSKVRGLSRPGSLYCRGMKGVGVDIAGTWKHQHREDWNVFFSSIRKELKKCTDGDKRVSLQQASGLVGMRPLSRFYKPALLRDSWSALPGSPLEGAFDTIFHESPKSC